MLRPLHFRMVRRNKSGWGLQIIKNFQKVLLSVQRLPPLGSCSRALSARGMAHTHTDRYRTQWVLNNTAKHRSRHAKTKIWLSDLIHNQLRIRRSLRPRRRYRRRGRSPRLHHRPFRRRRRPMKRKIEKEIHKESQTRNEFHRSSFKIGKRCLGVTEGFQF